MVKDKKAVAEALALLSRSLIANNLNQLAYHADIGEQDMNDSERTELSEAYEHLLCLRGLLVIALG
ncbi:MAG: hypothetical protein AAF393_07870 [Pseudomonadota bacterium]